MKKLIYIILFGITSFPVYSQIIHVESITINDGTVTIPGFSSELLAGNISPVIMGQYQGSSACCSPAAAQTSLAYTFLPAFSYFGFYTSQNDYLSSDAPPPSAYVDTDNSSINIDLSSWTFSWNGRNLHQGNEDITGSYNNNTGEYNINWSSLISAGPLAGYEQTFNITGYVTVSSVPIPASIWLFISGITGIFSIARRKALTTI